MKIILTLYSQNFPEKMKKRSEDLYVFLEKRGIVLCRGFVFDYDNKGVVFKKALFFRKGEWIWLPNIKPDLVYDRSLWKIRKGWQATRKIIAKEFSFINDLKLNKLLTNKWLTYNKFKEFSPKTVLISGKKELKKIKGLDTELVILKPLFGSRGVGIKIFPKKEIGKIEFPCVAQNLISTTKGISGLVKGPHDLRVIMADEKIIHSFLRMPRKGMLIANLAQGGTLKLVSEKKLPASVKIIIKSVSNKLKKYPKKLYSIDFIIDNNQKPWIIELNSRPSLVLDKEELANRESYYKNLKKFFSN